MMFGQSNRKSINTPLRRKTSKNEKHRRTKIDYIHLVNNTRDKKVTQLHLKMLNEKAIINQEFYTMLKFFEQ